MKFRWFLLILIMAVAVFITLTHINAQKLKIISYSGETKDEILRC